MADAPLISVITVTRNLIQAGRRDLFLKAMECVQAQSYGHVEHVIFDGQSDDGTVAMIAEAVDRLSGSGHPVVFESAPDAGLYDAMNKAVALASGDYVLFLNSDDSLAGEIVLTSLAANISDACPDFLFGATLEQPDKRNSVLRHPNPLAVLQRMPFSHNSVLIKTSVFSALGGHDLRYRVAADYDLVLRMIGAGYQGQDACVTISIYHARGVSGDDARVGDDYADIWLRYFSSLVPEIERYSHEDAFAWYKAGSFPLHICWAVMASGDISKAMRKAARHSFFKSLRRALQPWRKHK